MFFYRFDCYHGIYVEINIVHNNSDSLILVSIKDVSAWQETLHLYESP